VTDLVRIQTRVSKRHYLRAKRTYEYGRISLDIPKKFHEAIRSFLHKDLEIEINVQNDSVVIVLTRREKN
jgi:hypothetical protein